MLVRSRSIIIPPPAPTKPQMSPTIVPQMIDWITRFFALTSAIFSFGVMTGLTMNLIPNSIVIITEKPPIVLLGTMLAAQLPTKVNANTVAIMTSPLRISRFLFFPYVYALTALASTSLARAIPTAS